jgi:hypothetical protein
VRQESDMVETFQVGRFIYDCVEAIIGPVVAEF